MTPVKLPPFINFLDNEFHVGGDPSAITQTAVKWRRFAYDASDGAESLRDINVGSFEGSEGEDYRELVKVEYAHYLQNMAAIHEQVGLEMEGYGGVLESTLQEMDVIVEAARTTHTNVNLAVDEWAAARTAYMAATDPVVKSGFFTAMNDAANRWSGLMETWNGHLRDATGLKNQLKKRANDARLLINRLEKEQHWPKVGWWRRHVLAGIDNFFDRHADFLNDAADAAGMAPHPLAQVGAAALYLALWATGNADGSIMKRLVTGKTNRIRQVLAPLYAANNAQNATVGNRGTAAGEPIDMASGALVDREEDIRLAGTLPLTITRTLNTSLLLDVGGSYAFGTGWFSELDVCLEVHDDTVFMLTADGAVLTFPAPPSDGSEVSADGRAMRLSYGDGTYRVRDLENAVTWSFSVGANQQTPLGPIEDGVASSGSDPLGAGVRPGSVGAVIAGYMTYRVTGLVDRTGMSVSVQYNPRTNRAERVQRLDGSTLHLEWDEIVGRVSRISLTNEHTHPDADPLVLATYEYGPRGELLRVINSHEKSLSYYYDDSGRVNGWTDRNGIHYLHIYDDHGRVIAQAGSGGAHTNALVWAPDEETGGQICVLLETAGDFDPEVAAEETVAEVEARARSAREMAIVTALESGSLEWADLSEQGHLLVDDTLGDVRPSVYRSTPTGDVWEISSPSGRRENFEYNQWHQKTRIVSATGHTTRIGYSDYGHPVHIVHDDGTEENTVEGPWGQPVKTIDRAGRVTTFDVDDFGVTTAVHHPDGATETYEYDIRATGIFPTVYRDADGVATIYECNDAGLVTAQSDDAGHRCTLVRDMRGLIVEIINPAGESTRIGYSPEGWANHVTHQDGTTQRAVYDGEGNQIQRINEIGNSAVTSYTAMDKPWKLVDESGAETRIDYNSQMQPVAFINADGRSWTFRYDLDGNCVGQTDFNGISTNLAAPGDNTITTVSPMGETIETYNQAGLLLRKEEPGQTTVYEYDALGRLSSLRNDFTTIDFGYDDYSDRVLSEVVTLYSGEETQIHYSYTAAGRLTQRRITLPSGEVINAVHTHDSAGDTAAINLRSCRGHNADEQWLDTFEFDTTVTGQRAGLRVNALVEQRTYDSRNRLVRQSIMHGGRGADRDQANEIASRGYQWRADDVLTGIRDGLGGDRSFEVDDLGHLTCVTKDGGSTESYGFSAAGKLNSIDDGTAASDYDALVHYRGTAPVRVGRTSLEYDGLNRVTTTRTTRLSQKPLVKNFYYHPTSTQPIGFDSSDHPNLGWRYLYDGAGRRVAKEKIDKRTNTILERLVFIYSGDRLYAQQATLTPPDNDTKDGYTSDNNAGETLVWVRDPHDGHVVAQITLGSPCPQTALVTTGLSGAPEHLIDSATGELIGSAISTAYGQRQWRGESSPLLFAGQYFDEESGWAYNRFRYYHPQLAVYNAQDPLGVDPKWSSAQAYVDHPAMMIDLLGLKSCTQLGRDGERVFNKVLVDAYGKKKVSREVSVNVTVSEPEVYLKGSDVPRNIKDRATNHRQARTRVDFVAQDKHGNLHFYEVKTGDATLTTPQAALRDEINANRDDDKRIVWDSKRYGTNPKPVQTEDPTWATGQDKLEGIGVRNRYLDQKGPDGKNVSRPIPGFGGEEGKSFYHTVRMDRKGNSLVLDDGTVIVDDTMTVQESAQRLRQSQEYSTADPATLQDRFGPNSVDEFKPGEATRHADEYGEKLQKR
ncbi:Putative deoxyribonuclease RhsC [Corynebacterium cystitidis DSM 20524]|uniref:DUF6531 domain-containing protein n=1 Tax=Corynebacterium cystitidis TaxID=35757 RepID=UPI000B94A5AA|nr:DUF6531 domain-containing protein [Corynebacterium cystitidis]WJY83698.1 Putative deoxyribonuclease RhsC [Corynebacterium cystitidis DSM 20524]SNV91258.1 Uncharacterized conserved protein [Corynebacterium cystitidis]